MKTLIISISQALLLAIIIIAMSNIRTKALNPEDPDSLLVVAMQVEEKIIEKEIEVEDWMTNTNVWNASSITKLLSANTEHELEYQVWMSNKSLWDDIIYLLEYNEKESEIDKKAWMENFRKIDCPNYKELIIDEQEQEITLQKWMFYRIYWIIGINGLL